MGRHGNHEVGGDEYPWLCHRYPLPGSSLYELIPRESNSCSTVDISYGDPYGTVAHANNNSDLSYAYFLHPKSNCSKIDRIY